MISKDFIDHISKETGIDRKELIEKDLLLQQLLRELKNNPYFEKNFVFKGGTCLVKCYLGYYRFSEDLDFSWIKQNIFKNKSEKKIRKILSEEINKIIHVLEDISKKLSLDFKSEKNNKKYLEFGGSNKFVTFKTWYKSTYSHQKQFIKIQINFVELFKYEFKKKIVLTTSKINLERTDFLFPKEAHILKNKIEITSYDMREILLEKSRAIMTRRGMKMRDLIDLYFITKHLKNPVKDYEEKIIEKTVFMFTYEKYKTNFLNKELASKISMAEIEGLLLKKTGKDFEKFIKETIIFFNKLIETIKHNLLH